MNIIRGHLFGALALCLFGSQGCMDPADDDDVADDDDTVEDSDCQLHVPANHATIQDAIETASPHDTICVAPGTYHEQIDFHGMPLRVLGEMGRDATIIDAGTGRGQFAS